MKRSSLPIGLLLAACAAGRAPAQTLSLPAPAWQPAPVGGFSGAVAPEAPGALQLLRAQPHLDLQIPALPLPRAVAPAQAAPAASFPQPADKLDRARQAAAKESPDAVLVGVYSNNMNSDKPGFVYDFYSPGARKSFGILFIADDGEPQALKHPTPRTVPAAIDDLDGLFPMEQALAKAKAQGLEPTRVLVAMQDVAKDRAALMYEFSDRLKPGRLVLVDARTGELWWDSKGSRLHPRMAAQLSDLGIAADARVLLEPDAEQRLQDQGFSRQPDQNGSRVYTLGRAGLYGHGQRVVYGQDKTVTLVTFQGGFLEVIQVGPAGDVMSNTLESIDNHGS